MDPSIQDASQGFNRWVGLINSLESCEATIGVIGLGYVGLPVALAFCEAGFNVIGVDVNPERVEPLRSGYSSITDVTDERLVRANETGRFTVDCDYAGLAAADAVLICVPTPLTEGIPDVSAITWAGTALGEVLKSGSIVVLESTTYPGTTEDVLAPLIGANGKEFGEDFLLAFSPERIDPGNPQFAFEDIPKIVGGADEDSTRVAETLYSKVVPKVVTVGGTREAEMAKLIENTFRHVNIALVNELATYAHAWGIDIWEAIDAAASKPFGYMPFYPGPGWGGHCIPLDPSYLSWRVRKEHAHEMRFVELAQSINAEMPRHVVERIAMMLNDKGRSIRGSRILGVGVTYKPGTDDTRGSAGLKVLAALAQRGADVTFYDPLVDEIELGDQVIKRSDLNGETLLTQDIVVFLVPQSEEDVNEILDHAPLVFDTCNATKRRGNGRIVRL